MCCAVLWCVVWAYAGVWVGVCVCLRGCCSVCGRVSAYTQVCEGACAGVQVCVCHADLVRCPAVRARGLLMLCCDWYLQPSDTTLRCRRALYNDPTRAKPGVWTCVCACVFVRACLFVRVCVWMCVCVVCLRVCIVCALCVSSGCFPALPRTHWRTCSSRR
jgi:hypothetical protein